VQPLLPKVPLKELVCDDQGFKCATKIPVAGSNCIVNSRLVGARSWRREVQSHGFFLNRFLFRYESRTCPYALGFVATMVIHLIHRDQSVLMRAAALVKSAQGDGSSGKAVYHQTRMSEVGGRVPTVAGRQSTSALACTLVRLFVSAS